MSSTFRSACLEWQRRHVSPDAGIGRRRTQLLDSATGGEDRRDSQSREPYVAGSSGDGRLLRQLRRILRHPTREHVNPRDGRFRRGFRSLGRATEAAARERDTSFRGAWRFSWPGLHELPHCGGDRGEGNLRTRPLAPDEPEHFGLGNDPEYGAESGAPGSAIRKRSSPAV